MSEEATELLKKALTLPLEERAELASSLMESLDLIQDEDVEAAWQEEIARRIEDLRTGRAKTVPWTEVRKKAQAILHEETH
jgi:putative addiction module component (TIGR02574 family)